MATPLAPQGLFDREAHTKTSDRFLPQQLGVELDHVGLLDRQRPVLRQCISNGCLAAGFDRRHQLLRVQPGQFSVDSGDGIQFPPGGGDGVGVELLQICHRVVDGADPRHPSRDREGDADPLKVSSTPAVGRVDGGLAHEAAGAAVSSCLRGTGVVGAGARPTSPARVAGLSSSVGLLIALAVARASWCRSSSRLITPLS